MPLSHIVSISTVRRTAQNIGIQHPKVLTHCPCTGDHAPDWPNHGPLSPIMFTLYKAETRNSLISLLIRDVTWHRTNTHVHSLSMRLVMLLLMISVGNRSTPLLSVHVLYIVFTPAWYLAPWHCVHDVCTCLSVFIITMAFCITVLPQQPINKW